MITNKFSIFTKKERLLIKIISIIQIIIGLLLIMLAIAAAILTIEKENNQLIIISLILGLAGIISLIEIILKNISNRKTFAIAVLLRLHRRKSNFYNPTKTQIEICSWLSKKTISEKSVLICGRENTGKTFSILIYLTQYIKEKDFLKNIDWSENVLYIDCKNNKTDIINFFNNPQTTLSMSHPMEKSLIIIDNIETMSKTFWENLISKIESTFTTFVMIADISEKIDINNDIIETNIVKEEHDIKVATQLVEAYRAIYNKMSCEEKIILLTAYYISLSSTLIPKESIYSVLISKFSVTQIKRGLKKLIKNKMLAKFPFDHNYILILNQKVFYENQHLFWDSKINTEVIGNIIENATVFPESAWLSFIHLPYDIQLSFENTKKERLFYNALICGNYNALKKALENEIIFSPRKEMLFLYEMGTLSFYNSQQEKAFLCFNTLLSNTYDTKLKLLTMLKIIESTHGDINYITQNNIRKYLLTLLNAGNSYSLYAQYWKLHIESEKGNFNISDYKQLLFNLLDYKNFFIREIHYEIIKRCYTDLIRLSHILLINIEDDIIKGFKQFLKNNYNEMTYEYYYYLYIQANQKHYVDFFNILLRHGNCHQMYQEAEYAYEAALKLGYQNIKSVSATELKNIDLKSYVPENLEHFEKYCNTINSFMANAEINKVDVHVAYCKTLLLKLHMIKNLHDEKTYLNNFIESQLIETYIKDSKKVYQTYQNEYGVLRIDFIKFLYDIALENNIETKKENIKKYADILKEFPEYRRENKILHSLNEHDNKMFIISILKAYPIIMQ